VDHPDRPAPGPVASELGVRRYGDVLDGGPERPPWSTRLVVAATALLVVVGLVAGALELRERRAAAAAERRAAGIVELALLDRSGAGVSPTPQGGLLDVQLGVRNDGPREVEVAGALWAGHSLIRPVRVPAGDERRLLLRQVVDCAAGRPDLLPVDEDVALQVRTASTVRTVRLPLPAAPIGPAEAARLCGFVPLVEALLVLGQRQALTGRALVLELDLAVRGGAPVELVGLDAGPGLTAAARDQRGRAGAAPAHPAVGRRPDRRHGHLRGGGRRRGLRCGSRGAGRGRAGRAHRRPAGQHRGGRAAVRAELREGLLAASCPG
jgi:hypothetical protein